ncbi:hypothetical protein Cni_G05865 [Canna indica]|uniref:Uncharacterized protein n=1 Tax=Canna indica TaxID=4628 RepID=A0AAQ3JY02_9LILI|nr:hypothetical protein Cni_G05865 [Canna indica]
MAKAMCSDNISSSSQYLGTICSNLEPADIVKEPIFSNIPCSSNLKATDVEVANVETTNIEPADVVEEIVHQFTVDKGKKPMLKAASNGSSSSSGYERFELVPSRRSMHYDPYIEALIHQRFTW